MAQQTSSIVDQVRQRLVNVPVLHGEFEQRKTLKGFRNPLVSKGSFIIARDRGILWKTREPFPSTLLLTRENLISRTTDKNNTKPLDAPEDKNTLAINELIFAIMAADLTALSRQFHIEGMLVGGYGWKLQLKPRDAALSQWATYIDLEGDQQVHTVRISETQGDQNWLHFSDLVVAPKLTQEESKHFE